MEADWRKQSNEESYENSLLDIWEEEETDIQSLVVLNSTRVCPQYNQRTYGGTESLLFIHEWDHKSDGFFTLRQHWDLSHRWLSLWLLTNVYLTLSSFRIYCSYENSLCTRWQWSLFSIMFLFRFFWLKYIYFFLNIHDVLHSAFCLVVLLCPYHHIRPFD